MRPVTIESIADALQALEEPLTFEEFLQKCGCTPTRAKEVLRQILDMGFATLREGFISLTPAGESFLRAYENRENFELHRLLLGYEPYQKLYTLLLTGGSFSAEELMREVGVSSVTLDILIRIMRKLGIRVRKNEEGQYYMEKDSIDYNEFKESVKKCYAVLFSKSKLPRAYIPIPELREAVKAQLKISDELFNKLFQKFVYEQVGRVVLVPAPTAVRKGYGLKLGKIEYYYVYIR